ncbi:MAG: sensor histidine kinase [Fusobacterium sp.]|uniref:sensor histidine kinase n=1 Tax=Fusobacterium sp. TaxID=68766 RepID=UPI003FA18FD9
MEELKYIIEDSTIAELLGVQNFTNAESAILELVKNAYDAEVLNLTIKFNENQLIIEDDGIGMNAEDIKKYWMHIGKSQKKYNIIDKNNKNRVLAGSKGLGRFALARLGESVRLFSKKENDNSVVWTTDWNSSKLDYDNTFNKNGTKIIIDNLRDKWGKRKVENLADFLQKIYNDDSMKIKLLYNNEEKIINKHFLEPILGENCTAYINLFYNSIKRNLTIEIKSDEFQEDAKKYCPNIDLKFQNFIINLSDELKGDFDLDNNEIDTVLTEIGNFKAQFYFYIASTTQEMEKFLYKYKIIRNPLKSGIVLYRNAFGISSYEGNKDWLGLGKRARKSPAAASHPTGAWRVRENQLSGMIEIDKKNNKKLQDLSNRQGLEENIYYQVFIEIINRGIKEFERYRQEIIRKIVKNNKNSLKLEKKESIISKIISNPKSLEKLSIDDKKELVIELKNDRDLQIKSEKDKKEIEERYKYDVQILNVLATNGLKASSIAHEMKNDRNIIAFNNEYIIDALKEYKMWDILNTEDKTKLEYKNVPYLLDKNTTTTKKILLFIDSMLDNIEKSQFQIGLKNIVDIVDKIKEIWKKDYSWINIEIKSDRNIDFELSEDILHVVFDNLILNSIQQNEEKQNLDIKIYIEQIESLIKFKYTDNGKGLEKKYLLNPKKILEVHETTRKNGHGLGMWILNNTVNISGGEILSIKGEEGFSIEFTLGRRIKANGRNKNNLY